MTSTGSANSKERELVIERVFDAPLEVVFDAWSKPEHLTQWFGPDRFTVPQVNVDFRIGGSYRLCMRSPEGEDHWVWGEYRDIKPSENLVFSWNREDSEGNIWNSTVVYLTFADEGGKTRFLLRQTLFPTVEDRNDHSIGWGQCLDRLGVYLSTHSSN